ncbi:hypothetical protein PVAP13_9KG129885 [Panicum virgatum]|uniref:Uncharacterized protein n=1 Tax=Panicum virgatum TaxID=38727 RepID=A0A8T0NI13_PANVG|nr:hypothetical protein PVAP13_9KG129885 [Panicum virgatum]
MPTRRQPTTTIPGQAFPAGPCQARKPNGHHFDHGSCLVLRPAAWRLLLCHLPSQPLCRLRPCRRARAQASSELQPLARPHLPAVRPGGGRKEGRTGGEAPPTSALAAAAVTGGTGNSLTPCF